MTTIRVVSAAFFAAILAVACGPGAECARDNDCKGTRVCTQGACVDPGGTGGGQSGTGGGQSGTGGGQSGTGGGQSGTGGGQSGTGGGQSGTGGGHSGTGGGQGGNGGGGNQFKACIGGKDSDCPTGSWCNQKICEASTKGRVGTVCTINSDCAGNSCLYRNPNDVAGYCSKLCQSFSECITFWDCKEISNAAGTYCVQN